MTEFKYRSKTDPKNIITLDIEEENGTIFATKISDNHGLPDETRRGYLSYYLDHYEEIREN